MNEQTNQLLRELAEKLGTTTEFLWQVMISGMATEASMAYILACSAFVVFLLGVSSIVSALFLEDYDDAKIGFVIVGILFVVVSFVTGPASYFRYFLYSSNPEYAALKKIIELLN